jgi:hypothetical protein
MTLTETGGFAAHILPIRGFPTGSPVVVGLVELVVDRRLVF